MLVTATGVAMPMAGIEGEGSKTTLGVRKATLAHSDGRPGSRQRMSLAPVGRLLLQPPLHVLLLLHAHPLPLRLPCTTRTQPWPLHARSLLLVYSHQKRWMLRQQPLLLPPLLAGVVLHLPARPEVRLPLQGHGRKPQSGRPALRLP